MAGVILAEKVYYHKEEFKELNFLTKEDMNEVIDINIDDAEV
jgi:hypothetical protein